MIDHLERIREARDRRAHRAVQLFVLAATGWVIGLTAIAAAILQ